MPMSNNHSLHSALFDTQINHVLVIRTFLDRYNSIGNRKALTWSAVKLSIFHFTVEKGKIPRVPILPVEHPVCSVSIDAVGFGLSPFSEQP